MSLFDVPDDLDLRLEAAEPIIARVLAMFTDAIRGPDLDDVWRWFDAALEYEPEVPPHVADQCDLHPTLSIGGERGVVLRFVGTALHARLPTLVWLEPHVPTAASKPHRVVDAASLDDRALRAFIETCMRDREAGLALCRYYRRPYPPRSG